MLQRQQILDNNNDIDIDNYYGRLLRIDDCNNDDDDDDDEDGNDFAEDATPRVPSGHPCHRLLEINIHVNLIFALGWFDASMLIV